MFVDVREERLMNVVCDEKLFEKQKVSASHLGMAKPLIPCIRAHGRADEFVSTVLTDHDNVLSSERAQSDAMARR